MTRCLRRLFAERRHQTRRRRLALDACIRSANGPRRTNHSHDKTQYASCQEERTDVCQIHQRVWLRRRSVSRGIHATRADHNCRAEDDVVHHGIDYSVTSGSVRYRLPVSLNSALTTPSRANTAMSACFMSAAGWLEGLPRMTLPSASWPNVTRVVDHRGPSTNWWTNCSEPVGTAAS